MVSIGPIGCLFSRRCWANLDFCFHIWKCSWKRSLKGLSSLCNIFHVAGWACWLVDAAIFVFVFRLFLPCFQMVLYCIVCSKCDFNVGVLKYLCDKSGLFTNECKFGPFCSFYILFLFVCLFFVCLFVCLFKFIFLTFKYILLYMYSRLWHMYLYTDCTIHCKLLGSQNAP
jgi:hypothetical protein